MKLWIDDQHHTAHVQCVSDISPLLVVQIMYIEGTEITTVLMKNNGLSNTVCFPDKERLSPKAGVGRKMDVYNIAVLYHATKLKVGLSCNKQLAKPGSVLHGADIGEIDHLVKTGIVQVINNSRNSSMYAAIRADHENIQFCCIITAVQINCLLSSLDFLPSGQSARLSRTVALY